MVSPLTCLPPSAENSSDNAEEHWGPQTSLQPPNLYPQLTSKTFHKHEVPPEETLMKAPSQVFRPAGQKSKAASVGGFALRGHGVKFRLGVQSPATVNKRSCLSLVGTEPPIQMKMHFTDYKTRRKKKLGKG